MFGENGKRKSKTLRFGRFNIARFFAWEGEGSEIDVEVTDSGNQTAEVPNTTAPAKAESGLDWNTMIPEDLREKDYFKNILKAEDPGAELIKQFDNAQSLIGKKSGLPGADATDEDWDNFYTSIAPKSADEYELPELDLGEDKKEVTEFIKKNENSDFQKQVFALAHECKLPKKLFEKFADGYRKLTAGVVEEQMNAEKALSAHFDEISKKVFGGDQDKAVEFGKKFINEYASEKTKAYAAGLPNEALVVIADLAMAVNKKYDKEDDFDPNPSPSASGGTVESISAEIQKLMSNDAYFNSFDPDHDRVMKEVKALSKRKADLLKTK